MVTEHRGEIAVQCSFCGGSGRDPFGIMSLLSTCCVCGGRGFVRVPEPYMRCSALPWHGRRQNSHLHGL